MKWIIVPKDSDLVHHGRLGQKWGHRNGPPYPLDMAKSAYKAAQKAAVGTGKAVAATAKGTAKVVGATARGTATVAKALKKHHDASKEKAKAKKYAKERKKTEKMKNKAISSNSYQKLYEMKDRLSYKELSDAITRIELEQKVYGRAYPPKPSLMSRINSISSTLNTLNNWYQTGKNTWNNIAELHNSTEAGQRHPMRKIGGKPYKPNKDKNKNKQNKNNQNNNNQP